MNIKRKLAAVIALLVLCAISGVVMAQEPPPRPVTITYNSSQPLAFGAFSPGAAGGTVTVNPDGTRSSAGDIVLLSLGFAYTPAMFYIEANEGTVLSILIDPPVTLTGSGGGTITLQAEGTLPTSPFVTTVPWPEKTTVLVGGILTIGNIVANPPGNYTGNFSITLVQE
ncbi:MAG: DUF4402 domain-containing protein [Bacteroidales bacterium]